MEVFMKKCDGCGKVFFAEELSEFKEGMMLCDECMENHFVCEACENDIFTPAENLKGFTVCEACADTHYVCDGCGNLFHEKEEKPREGKIGDLYCSDCYYLYEECKGDMYAYYGVSAKDFI
jgi:formylmethanofuran dehydrogenase subunit E